LPTVTMIQKEQAVLGHEFIFNRPAAECQECRVKAACLNLSDGRRYRVTRLRNVTHDCVLSGDVVRVVEVEPSSLRIGVDANAARDGSTLSYQMAVCNNLSCDNFRLCRPQGLFNDMKVRILEVGERLNCPLGMKLVSVKAAYAED